MRYLKVLLVILSLIAFWGIARFCHHQTAGFRLTKLDGNTTPFENQLPSPLSCDQKNDLDQLLKQRFTYLGRGKQSFAFVSEDGKTVLKFFNNRLQRRAKWLSSTTAKQKLEKVFQSYQIAYDALREETGLLYFHPRAGLDQFEPVTVVDRLGIAHQIDLNKHGFVLQKRAILALDYLKQQTEEKRAEAIASLVDLLRSKMQRGIADNDPLIRANFGFYEDKPIQIDVGPLSFDESLKTAGNQRENLHKITLSLRHWLEKNDPQQIGVLDEAIEN